MSCRDNLLAHALEQCLRLADLGLPVDTFLSTTPELRSELEPLVRQALALGQLAGATPSPAFRSAARERIVRYAQTHPHQQNSPVMARLAPHLRWGVAAAAAAGAVVISGGLASASAALPGEPLYPVKLAVEDARIALAPDPAVRVELHLRSAERRVDELSALVADGRSADAQPAAEDYARRIAAVASAGEDAPEHAKAELDRLYQVLLNRLDAAPDPMARALFTEALQVSATARAQVGLETASPESEVPEGTEAAPAASPTAVPTPAPSPERTAPLATTPVGDAPGHDVVDVPEEAAEPQAEPTESNEPSANTGEPEPATEPGPASSEPPPDPVVTAPRPRGPAAQPANGGQRPAASPGENRPDANGRGAVDRERQPPAAEAPGRGPAEQEDRPGPGGGRGAGGGPDDPGSAGAGNSSNGRESGDAPGKSGDARSSRGRAATPGGSDDERESTHQDGNAGGSNRPTVGEGAAPSAPGNARPSTGEGAPKSNAPTAPPSQAGGNNSHSGSSPAPSSDEGGGSKGASGGPAPSSSGGGPSSPGSSGGGGGRGPAPAAGGGGGGSGKR